MNEEETNWRVTDVVFLGKTMKIVGQWWCIGALVKIIYVHFKHNSKLNS